MTIHRSIILVLFTALALCEASAGERGGLATPAGNYGLPLTLAEWNPIRDARNRLVRQFPLHWAAIQDQSDVIGLLIASGRSVDSRDELGRTPLMAAAAFGSVGAARTLLAQGADIDARDENGDSALHHSVRYGKVKSAEFLLHYGIPVDVAADKTGATPMHYAAALGSAPMIRFFAGKGADLNSRDHEGVSPIFYASRRNQRGAVELLRKLGARYGGLHEAVNANDVGRVLTLISRGVDIDVPNYAGTPLMIAAAKGFLGVTRILVDHGVDLEARSDFQGSTALHMAAVSGQPEIVEFLVARGAAIEAVDDQGRTALIMASIFGHSRVAKKLIDLGADKSAEDTVYGNMPIHWASVSGYPEIVELLIDAGIDADTRSAFGMTPLHFAARKDRTEVALRLLYYGANAELRDDFGNTPLMVFGCGANVRKLIVQYVQK